MAAVDFLSVQEDVNPDKIGIIGICGWGGTALNAAALDTRIKATVASTMYDMAIAIYFGDWIKTVLPINLLFLLLFVQLVYVGIRWYVKGWRETRGYY